MCSSFAKSWVKLLEIFFSVHVIEAWLILHLNHKGSDNCVQHADPKAMDHPQFNGILVSVAPFS